MAFCLAILCRFRYQNKLFLNFLILGKSRFLQKMFYYIDSRISNIFATNINDKFCQTIFFKNVCENSFAKMAKMAKMFQDRRDRNFHF